MSFTWRKVRAICGVNSCLWQVSANRARLYSLGRCGSEAIAKRREPKRCEFFVKARNKKPWHTCKHCPQSWRGNRSPNHTLFIFLIEYVHLTFSVFSKFICSINLTKSFMFISFILD